MCIYELLSVLSGSSLLFSSVCGALLSGDDSVSHSAGDELYCSDSVVVAGDNVVDLVRIAVGVNDSNNRDTELLSLSYCDLLLAGVNDEQSAGARRG